MMQFTGYLYLFDFGVRESVLRFVSKFQATNERQKINEYIRAALNIYSGIFAFCVFVTCGLSYLFPFIFDIPDDTIRIARIVVLITGLNVAQIFIFNVFVINKSINF